MSHEKSCCHHHDHSCHDHEEEHHHHCHSHDHHEHQHTYADELLAVADEAWEELLKDKIKEEILKTSGEKLTEIAKLVNQTNHDRWNGIMAEKNSEETYEVRLRNLLS